MISRQRLSVGIAILSALCGLGGTALSQDLEVRAYLDRTQVGVGEQFTLSVEMSGKDANSATPETPQMGDFATPLGSGTSSQIQVVNGQMSVTRTTTYSFQAAREGEFEIPRIRVRTPSGTLSTDPVRLVVSRTAANRQRPGTQRGRSGTQAGQGGELLLEASANKRRVYQGEAVVITYEIQTLVNVSSYSLVELPSTQGFWVEDYPIEQPQTRTEIIDGRRYTTATIKQMAVIPTTPGKKTIDPLIVECEVRVRRRREIFDDLFSDPFRRTQTRRVASLPIEIEVLPLPAEGQPENFSGGVGRFSVEAGFDQNEVEANQAVTLGLRIRGEGNITSVSVPEIELPASFESYPPETAAKTNRTASGLAGEKTLEYVIVPRDPGRFEIPPVEFAYFDPGAQQYRIASTGPIDLLVTPSDDRTLSADPTISKREVELLNEDIRFLKSETTLSRAAQGGWNIWLLLLGFLAPPMGLAGVYLLDQHRRKLSSDQGYARRRRSRKLARQRLASAKKLLDSGSQGDFYAEIDRAMNGFIADRLNLPEAGLLTTRIKETLLARGLPQEVVEQYADCVLRCQQKRFAPVGDSTAERQESLDEASSVIAQLERGLEKDGQGGS